MRISDWSSDVCSSDLQAGERALVILDEIGRATAMQESKLRNLSGGDRDSLGLFQQRPSQGWGTEAQIQDPVYASTAFFTKLEKQIGRASGRERVCQYV